MASTQGWHLSHSTGCGGADGFSAARGDGGNAGDPAIGCRGRSFFWLLSFGAAMEKGTADKAAEGVPALPAWKAIRHFIKKSRPIYLKLLFVIFTLHFFKNNTAIIKPTQNFI